MTQFSPWTSISGDAIAFAASADLSATYGNALSGDVCTVWESNGQPLNAEEHFEVQNSVTNFFSQIGRQETAPLPSQIQGLWNSIPYTTNQTAYPRISSPVDSALGHLNGLLLLWNLWGIGIADHWREADFHSPIRYEIGRNFHVTLSPGSHETVAGVDYRLHWEGLDANGEHRTVVLAVVGFIRHRDGFGITLVQGGPRLTEIKVLRNGRPTDLLKLTQGRFIQDPRAWLLQEVVRNLRKEFTNPNIYWLRAERRAPLYGHVLDPLSPRQPLFQKVGILPLEELRDLVKASPSNGQRLNAMIERLDQMALSLGFRPGDAQDPWWKLTASSV